MRKIRITGLLLITTLFLMSVGTAIAENVEADSCAGESVTGTVVSVDTGTGLVTIDTGGGVLCTVALAGDFEQPIVALFNTYFGNVSIGSLATALEGIQGWAVYDGDTWTWASEGDEGAVAVTVTGVVDNGGGTFSLEFTTGEGETGSASTEDAELAANLIGFLAALNVDWTLQTNEEGTVFVPGVGNAVITYREEGYGFGQLVKLYAIVEESQEACEAEASVGTTESDEPSCGVTLEELFLFLESGGGMGELFAEYWRPSMLGVGQVRQALNAEGSGEGENGNNGLKGICNARSNNGNANANGQPDIECEESGGGESAENDLKGICNALANGGNGNGNGNSNSNGNGNGRPDVDCD
ncbi:MAG: hypothetical protein FVQ83_03735 [Chloroflexi bacterium]|nr:hypothetical protein [Chloroflexota bacterium]